MSGSPSLGYSSKQIWALLIVLAAVGGYAVVRQLHDRSFVSDPQPMLPIHASELADRIDPNSADIASLSALPQVGERRARSIVAYREKFHPGAAGHPAFQRPEDLLRLSGFGVAIIDQLRPYLIFPSTAPTTTQSAE